MSPHEAPSRGKPILWFAVLCQAMVAYLSVRGGNYIFAVQGIALGAVFGLMAWKGEPAWGTPRATVIAGLFAVCAIGLCAALMAGPG